MRGQLFEEPPPSKAPSPRHLSAHPREKPLGRPGEKASTARARISSGLAPWRQAGGRKERGGSCGGFCLLLCGDDHDDHDDGDVDYDDYS